jgi:CHAD domain-containing protein
MADGKWIEGLHAQTPMPKAAREALRTRLEVVRQRLPQAVEQADKDPEHVHQLRVGTRRADAVLRIFRACLPQKTYKRARKRLRTLRKAAGAARDWDVFRAEIVGRQPSHPAAEQPGLDFLAGYATGKRAAAHLDLAEVGGKQMEHFHDFVAQTLDSVQPPAFKAGLQYTLVNLARPLLADRLRRLDNAAAGDLTDYSQLHQVRIAGKRLRYAMEVFAGCFAAQFTEVLYSQVEELQEVLGRANDSHVAATRLSLLRTNLKNSCPHVWVRLRPGIEVILRFHQRRLPQERRRFQRWWDHWLRPETADLWKQFIGEAEQLAVGTAAT